MNNYTIVNETSHYDLAEQVRKLIKDGWQPQGCVSITAFHGKQVWVQAMVK